MKRVGAFSKNQLEDLNKGKLTKLIIHWTCQSNSYFGCVMVYTF